MSFLRDHGHIKVSCLVDIGLIDVLPKYGVNETLGGHIMSEKGNSYHLGWEIRSQKCQSNDHIILIHVEDNSV